MALDQVFAGIVVELLETVFADRLQHPVPVLVATQQALVDERGERLELGKADLLDGLERGAADEHAEAAAELALLVAEEVERPRDRRAQRLLARIGVAS